VTARPQRVFSLTQLGPEVPPSVREVLQGMAQSIDQLVTGFQQITVATSISQLINKGPAGNFNGVLCIGVIGVANTATIFNHALGRTPIGALEMLALPQANQVAPVAASIAILAASNNQITLTSTAAHRQFTLILL
jgi:hypothetical protein